MRVPLASVDIGVHADQDKERQSLGDSLYSAIVFSSAIDILRFSSILALSPILIPIFSALSLFNRVSLLLPKKIQYVVYFSSFSHLSHFPQPSPLLVILINVIVISLIQVPLSFLPCITPFIEPVSVTTLIFLPPCTSFSQFPKCAFSYFAVSLCSRRTLCSPIFSLSAGHLSGSFSSSTIISSHLLH